MNSVAWPNMIIGNSTKVINNNEATQKSIHWLLSSESGDLFGDPDYGIKLQYHTFMSNNYILDDILKDEIYTKVKTFIPQAILDRNNIVITHENSKCFIKITYRNKIDYQINSYDIVLTREDE